MIQPALGQQAGVSSSALAETAPHDVGLPNEQLQSCVTESLERHALQLRQVKVTADRGCVRLTGRVRSYYLKQLAQERTLATAGVKLLENELVVE